MNRIVYFICLQFLGPNVGIYILSFTWRQGNRRNNFYKERNNYMRRGLFRQPQMQLFHFEPENVIVLVEEII